MRAGLPAAPRVASRARRSDAVLNIERKLGHQIARWIWGPFQGLVGQPIEVLIGQWVGRLNS